MSKFVPTLQWAGDRLREPSSYAGLAALFMFFHVADASSWAHVVMDLGLGVGGLIAIVLPEGKKQR